MNRRGFLAVGAGIAAAAWAGARTATAGEAPGKKNGADAEYGKKAAGPPQWAGRKPPALKDVQELKGDKHTPQITIQGKPQKGQPFVLEIFVGEGGSHPMAPEHHIEWVQVFDGARFLGEIVFGPRSPTARGTLTLALDKSTTLAVYEHCNLHGIWMNTIQVTV